MPLEEGVIVFNRGSRHSSLHHFLGQCGWYTASFNIRAGTLFVRFVDVSNTPAIEPPCQKESVPSRVALYKAYLETSSGSLTLEKWQEASDISVERYERGFSVSTSRLEWATVIEKGELQKYLNMYSKKVIE